MQHTLSSQAVLPPSSAILKTILPLPPGINKSYKIVRVPARRGELVRGTRIYSETGSRMVSRLGPTPELEAFKAQAALRLRDLQITNVNWQVIEAIKTGNRKVPLSISIKFFYPTLWRNDVDGGVKAVQDAVFEHLGINDNQIVQVIAKKFESREDPRVEVELSCVVGR